MLAVDNGEVEQAPANPGNIYEDGTYLQKTGGTWHAEDSPFKARSIAKMLARHPDIPVSSVCEIGCGAGAIIGELQKTLANSVVFTGYEISPQAHAMSGRFANERCRFVLGDAFSDSESFDLVLAIDVVEHVEDYFTFLRSVRRKGRVKIYHIPLDVHVSSILRGTNMWDIYGHFHVFTIETALKALEHSGHRVIDWLLTDGAVEVPKYFRTRLLNVLRRPVGKFSPKIAARLFGGYSILVLAE
jgi:SAM-dependent methyltransferase